MFEEKLEARKKMLEKFLAQVEQNISKEPEGTLRVSRSNGSVQYYHRISSSDRQGKYISKKDRALASELAQKEYNARLRSSLKEEIRAIDLYLNTLPENTPEEMYDILTEERKKLVRPAIMTDEMFRQKWGGQQYKKKPFGENDPELLTDRGERVRSKSEIIIANLLLKENIPYLYERPLRLKGLGIVHPDFTILKLRQRKEMFWEHFGKMDKPDYAMKAVNKISMYIRNNYLPGRDLIITFETDKSPINIRDIKILISTLK